MNTGRRVTDDLRQSYRQQVIAWVLMILVISVAWWWFAVTPTPVGGPQMRFVDAHADTPQTLCPGDVLAYDIAVQVTRPGVYSVDVSVWRLNPPATVVFSDERRVVFSAPALYELERAWQIPPTHIDPNTGAMVACSRATTSGGTRLVR